MKNTLFILATILVFTSCATLFPTQKIAASLAGATAQKWILGARDAGRGVTFQLKFYKPTPAFTTDTLLVNGVPMTTEVTHVGDTTFVTSFYSTQEENSPLLVTDTVYTGKLNIYSPNKQHKLPIKSFTNLPVTIYP